MSIENTTTITPTPVTLPALYRVFFWIGVFSFGGGLTPWMHREIVEARGWMTRDQFLSGLAVSQILPGVNSTNLAIFIGQRLRGALGAMTTLAGMLTAPFALILVAAVTYDTLLSVQAVAIALVGVAAAATGMLLRMGITSARAGLRSVSSAVAMAITFVLVGVLQGPVLPALAVVVPLRVAAARPRGEAHA